MSATAANLTAPASFDVATAVLHAARAAADWARRAYAIRRTRRALHALGDRALADIGLNRSDIDRIVRERLGNAGPPSGRHAF